MSPAPPAAVCLEQRLTLGVILARKLVLVLRRAVGFHNQVLTRPAEVRNDTAAREDNRHVHIR